MSQENDEKTSPVFTLAGETRDALSWELLPQRLHRYEKARMRALDVADYIEVYGKSKRLPFKPGTVSKLRRCGEYLLFRDYYTIGEVRLHAANFCQLHMLDPLCDMRRASKFTAAYLVRLLEILKERPFLRPYLVTFTVKDGPDLLERFNHLKRCYQIMNENRKAANHGRRPPVEMNKAAGGVYTYEIKRGKNSGEWHVHIHSVWLCEERPLAMRLSEDWREVTGDSFIVDVTPFDDEKDFALGFLEVFAYTLKFSTMTIEDQVYAASLFRGKRLLNSFGVFRGVEIPEELTDEPIENLPFVELLYRFIVGSGYNLIPKKIQSGL